MSEYNHCFICGKPAKVVGYTENPSKLKVECERCSSYEMAQTLAAATVDWDTRAPKEKRYILSGILRQRENTEESMLLFSHASKIKEMIQAANVPADPIEAIERLLLYICNKSNAAGDTVPNIPNKDYPVIFAKSGTEFSFLIGQAKGLGWIDLVGISDDLRLAIDGWKKVAELKSRNANLGRFAFMAMQYGDDEHDEIYNNYLVPAVEQTGFELKLLKNLLGAGLIDNQLRVQIRRAKFLLADLTNKNLGTYWEAGYAEGLGKQVIYLCKESEFKEMKTHFDTNHHTTIRWDKGNTSQAVEELKATIRATFPAEAKMDDK
ncbi:MAG: hypothetical protein ABSA44_13015 [Bacteroidota bacterium]|jgi:hypothetical protein